MKTKTKAKAKIKILIGIVLVLLICIGGFLFVQNDVAEQSNQIDKNTLAQCGTVDYTILTDPEYQPSESEMETTIKALTCINEAVISCTPSTLLISRYSEILSVNVEGEEELGCRISIPGFAEGERITCPMPSDIFEEAKKKFALSKYDATIVMDLLIKNIGAEISSGNKTGLCSVTK